MVEKKASPRTLADEIRAFFDETNLPYSLLVALTHETFFQKNIAVRENNKLEHLLKYLVTELEEQLEAWQADWEDEDWWVNLVNENGDLHHLLHDLLMLLKIDLTDLFISSNGYQEPVMVADYQQHLVIKEKLSQSPSQTMKDTFAEIEKIQKSFIDLSDNPIIIRPLVQHIMTLTHQLGINLIYAVLMKNLRNQQKYPAEIMNSAFEADPTNDYAAQKPAIAAAWKEAKMDDKSFSDWMALFPIELSLSMMAWLEDEREKPQVLVSPTLAVKE